MDAPLLFTGFPPALIFIAGGLMVPLFKGRLKSAFMLMLPIWAFVVMVQLPEGQHWVMKFADLDLIPGRVDRLSRVFGYIFTLVSLIAVIFSLNVRDDLQYTAGFVYAGGALGVTLAGDVFTLYIFWEVMAVASTFLILARRTRSARAAAFRYILVHILGGLCLLAGIVLFVHKTGGTAFGLMELKGVDAYLIFIGIAVNAAIPPLHPWLSDAYPEATVAGAVFLSAFTTKSAVYLMARTFAGTELLIYLGALMTAVPIFYAVLENDIRRVLAYSLINQVGFMMCGIGIGTQLAVNGVVSHAFCHILYKALLFMAAGSVLHVTGRIRCTDLGGLYKTMPLTCLFCMIGAASISAFPFFSGFVSKSMIVSAAAHEKLAVVWLLLQFASAGVFHHAGIKVPYFMFFGHDSGIRAKEPPLNMLIAMALAAFICIFLGVYPEPLYRILPYAVVYVPYTGAHVVGQLQLLMFGALAFCLLILSGYYPAEIRAVNLDADWFYRKGARAFYRFVDGTLNGLNRFCENLIARRLPEAAGRFTENASARMVMILVGAVQKMWGVTADRRSQVEENIQAVFSIGMIPLGISVAATVMILCVLFFIG